MRPRSGLSIHRRSGKILILTVLLLPVFIGAAAVVVDLGLQITVRAKLRTVADASALAGARALALEYINNPSESTSLKTSSAISASSTVAGQTGNYVLGSSLTLLSGTSGDVRVGYLNFQDVASTLDVSSGMQSRFNSVEVTAARTSTRGNPVPAAFSAIWGITGLDVSVRSTATADLYAIKGMSAGNSTRVNLIPIVMPKENYDAMTSGTTPDQYRYDSATNTVTSGSDGIGESQLYPIKGGSPGNWGTVKVGVNNNSTSVLGDQIRNGLTAAQMATYPNSTIQLDSSLSPPSLTLGGNPGLSAGIKDDVAAIVGQARPVLIYDQSGGNGNNAWYRCTGFAMIRIVASDFKGGDKYVTVQPARGFDVNAIPGAPLPGGWQNYGGLVRLNLTR